MAKRIVVVTGASGAGKTTMVNRLAARKLDGIACFFFDSIGVPTADEMPPDWQATSTMAWIRRLANEPVELAVLDGQTRPTYVLRALAEVGVPGSVVMIDCARPVRDARLVARGHPELATNDMHVWSGYLRGQADALGTPVIDTTELDPEGAAEALLAVLRR